MNLDLINPSALAALCGTTEPKILALLAQIQAGTPPFGLDMLVPGFILDRNAVICILDYHALECASDVALINVVKLVSANPLQPEIIESDYLEALIKKRYARKQAPRYHKNLKPKKASTKNSESLGRLYVFACKELNVIKIGYSVNVTERLKSIQTGYPYQLEIIFTSEPRKDVRQLEQKIHKILKKYRTRNNGEWFKAEAYIEIDWQNI